MLNLIKADFYRALKDKAFIIMLCICGGFAVLYPIFTFLIQFLIYPDVEKIMNEISPYSVSFSIISAMSINAFILPIFVLILIAKDVMAGTLRNKIIVGKTRTQVYLANLIFTLIVILGVAIVTEVIALIVSFIFFHGNLTADAFLEYLGLCGLALIGWVFISFLVGVCSTILKNVGLGICAYFVTFYIFLIIGVVFLSIIIEGMNPYTQIDPVTIDVMKVFLNINPFYTMIFSLAPSGGLSLADAIGAISGAHDGFFYLEYILSCVVFALLFGVLGYLFMRNRELK